MADHIRYGQDYLLKNTTLGIPALVQTEGIHGLRVINATIFNSPIGYGSSWNRKLVRRMAEIIGQETAALGINQIFAPVLDLARELRFGRVKLEHSMTTGIVIVDGDYRLKRLFPKILISPVRSGTSTSRACRATMFRPRSSILWPLVCRSRELTWRRCMAESAS